MWGLWSAATITGTAVGLAVRRTTGPAYMVAVFAGVLGFIVASLVLLAVWTFLDR